MLKSLYIILVIVFYIFLNEAFAQDSVQIPCSKKISGSFNLGLVNGLNPGISTSANYINKDKILSLRYTHFSKIIVDKDVWDFGILYGKVFDCTDQKETWSMSVGLSLIGRYKIDDSNYNNFIGDVFSKKNKYTVGIPFVLTGFYDPIPYFGLGFNCFGNINLKAPYFGLSLGVQIGKLH